MHFDAEFVSQRAKFVFGRHAGAYVGDILRHRGKRLFGRFIHTTKYTMQPRPRYLHCRGAWKSKKRATRFYRARQRSVLYRCDVSGPCVGKR